LAHPARPDHNPNRSFEIVATPEDTTTTPTAKPAIALDDINAVLDDLTALGHIVRDLGYLGESGDAIHKETMLYLGGQIHASRDWIRDLLAPLFEADERRAGA